MCFPTKEEVRCIREKYPIGCRVKLIKMGPDPFSKLKPGDEGAVTAVDDTGTVFVHWDCGSGLGMVHGVDHILRLDEQP